MHAFAARPIFRRLDVLLPSLLIAAFLASGARATAGNAPNLTRPVAISVRSNGQKIALTHGVSINLDNDKEHALLDKTDFLSDRPAFIAFLGRKNFFFREAEIINLRAYLQAGGSLFSSRSDIPFKREMIRAFPQLEFQI
jgi:hypothetical protein